MDSKNLKEKGSLVVVGTGISVSGQMTVLTQNHIKQADIVFTAIPNKVGHEYIKSLNSNAFSLTDLYEQGKSRADTYNEMMCKIVNAVKDGYRVCAAFYGHPGVFVDPSHQAIEVLRKQGYSVSMEPGISAEDCLYADLGIDPAAHGCQSYEATQFLLRNYRIDPYMLQIVWQVFCVGEFTASTKFNNKLAFNLLKDKLLNAFPSDHEVTIYEARTSPLFKTVSKKSMLKDLSLTDFTATSTLVVPGLGLPEYNLAILNKLNITFEQNSEIQLI